MFTAGLWQTYLENRKVKPSTAYSYRSMLTRYLLPAFGANKLDQVTTAAMTLFFSKVPRRLSAQISAEPLRTIAGDV
jgi:hypothetical protein